MYSIKERKYVIPNARDIPRPRPRTTNHPWFRILGPKYLYKGLLVLDLRILICHCNIMLSFINNGSIIMYRV